MLRLLDKTKIFKYATFKVQLNSNSFMSPQIAGKYTFVSQENFEEYLKAEDLGMVKRRVLAQAKPDMVVEINGDNFTVTTITSLKTIKISFTLGRQYTCDPGIDRVSDYITNLEGDDTLVTRNVHDASSTSVMKFTDSQLLVTMTAMGITATRTFKRA